MQTCVHVCVGGLCGCVHVYPRAHKRVQVPSGHACDWPLGPVPFPRSHLCPRLPGVPSFTPDWLPTCLTMTASHSSPHPELSESALGDQDRGRGVRPTALLAGRRKTHRPARQASGSRPLHWGQRHPASPSVPAAERGGNSLGKTLDSSAIWWRVLLQPWGGAIEVLGPSRAGTRHEEGRQRKLRQDK